MEFLTSFLFFFTAVYPAVGFSRPKLIMTRQEYLAAKLRNPQDVIKQHLDKSEFLLRLPMEGRFCMSNFCSISFFDIVFPVSFPLHAGPNVRVSNQSEVFVRHANFMKGVMDPKSTTGEYPPRRTSVKDFFIDKYPVTNEDFGYVFLDVHD